MSTTESTNNTSTSPPRISSFQGAVRRLRILCLLVIVGFYVFVGFAWRWPQDLAATGGNRVLVDHAAFMLRTFTFHGGVALLITAVFALFLKGHRLALAAAPGVIFAFLSLMPSFSSSLSIAPGPMLTLMSANLLYVNTDSADLLAQIERRNPDVIVFQEYTPYWHRIITDALTAKYPHSFASPQDDCFGQAVFSKLPFVDEPRLYPPAAPSSDPAHPAYSWPVPEIRAMIEFDGKPLVIRDIHLLPPAAMSYVREQRRQTLALAALLERERTSFIMAGDFNFTPDSAHYGALIDAGAVAAWHVAGSGRGSTWPRTGLLRYLPGIRLDNIFSSGDIECFATGVGEDFGSDHAPVWATFRWKVGR